MDQVPDPLRESSTIPTKCDDREARIRQLRTCCKRNDTTVQPMKAIALELIRTVPVTANVITQAYLPGVQVKVRERIFYGCPDAIIAAAVAPVALRFRVVFRKSRLGDSRSYAHNPARSASEPRECAWLMTTDATSVLPNCASNKLRSSS